MVVRGTDQSSTLGLETFRFVCTKIAQKSVEYKENWVAEIPENRKICHKGIISPLLEYRKDDFDIFELIVKKYIRCISVWMYICILVFAYVSLFVSVCVHMHAGMCLYVCLSCVFVCVHDLTKRAFQNVFAF